MVKRVLILQHVWENPKGYVGELLDRYGIAHDVINAATEALPNPRAYQAVIALGGSQHVYEAEKYAYFAAEMRLIQEVVAEDIPYLGICLGGQLFCSTLGGIVKKHNISEIGFYNVSLTEEGKQDPLYSDLPGYQKVFHWHEDTFELVEGCVLLASTAGAVNQAFRYGHRAYGLQYHIEVTQEMLYTWLHHPKFETDPEIVRMRGLERGFEHDFIEYQEHSHIMFKNFLRISELV